MYKQNSNSSSIGSIAKKILAMAIASICVLATLAFSTGCSTPQTELNPEDQTITASEYMVKLNQAAESLHENLNGFAAAINAGDITTLQSKVDAAFQSMDALSDLKTPDELAGVRADYKAAIDALRVALNDYIAVYVEIQSEPNLAQIDMNKYAPRFEAIQKNYDSGMNLLEKADTAAKEL